MAPNFDGTGPGGMGPLTGGGRGFCGVRIGRRGWGRGRGRGRGWGWFRSQTPKEETDALREQAQILKQQLNDIQGRIDILEKR